MSAKQNSLNNSESDSTPDSDSSSSFSPSVHLPNLFQWLTFQPELPLVPSSSFVYPYKKKEKGVLIKKIRSYMPLIRIEKCSPFLLFSRSPLRTLFLGNIGLIVGNSYESVLNFFSSNFGKVENLIMIGLCPFSLIEMSSIEDAMMIKSQLHEKALDEFHQRMLFVEYLNSAECSLWSEQEQTQHRMKLPPASAIQHSLPWNFMSRQEFQHFLTSTEEEKFQSVQNQIKRIKENKNSQNPSLEAFIPGLLLLEDFVSPSEEFELLNFLSQECWLDYRYRSVQHFGYEFDYEINNIHLGKHKFWKAQENKKENEKSESNNSSSSRSYLARYPPLFHEIIQRFRLIGQFPCIKAVENPEFHTNNDLFEPDQLTVNRYEPGQGISPHCDIHSPFTDIVVIISLGAQIVMEIIQEPKNQEKTENNQEKEIKEESATFVREHSKSQFPSAAPNATLNRLAKNRIAHNVILPPRSLLVLSHEVRYGFTHAIAARKTDRIGNAIIPRNIRTSLTFRQTRTIKEESTNSESIALSKDFSFVSLSSPSSAPGLIYSRSGPGFPVCSCAFPHLCDTQSGIAKKAKSHLKDSKEQSKNSKIVSSKNEQV
jgi:alkylated DNA repair dioxygenase AlkB